MTDERVQAAVIGGGVVGSAVLRELAQQGIDALLLEAEPSLCEGTSKANSAIVHTGFDAKSGTAEATMLRRAAALWPALVDELGVPFLDVGALMLARQDGDLERLAERQAGATALGVETELLDAASTRNLAPYLAGDVRGSLSIPGESIVDPFWLTRRLAEAGIAAGGRVWTDARVTALEVLADGVRIALEDGRSVIADQVLNCAGLWSDAVAALAGDSSFAITPRRGQFLISEETFGVDRIVLPLPSKMGKGMLVTPIVFGGVLLGPTAEDIDDKTDRSTDAAARDAITAACAAMVPQVDEMVPIRQFAGLRAVSSTGDYILRPATSGDRLFHVAGIRSTGISASPAIAEHVVGQVVALRGWARRRAAVPLPDATFDAEAGSVVCLCRSVSAAEIRATGGQPIPPATLDAAKRACGTTFGDCQGNLCAVPSVQLLSSILDRPPERIDKHREGSWLFLRGPRPPAVSVVARVGAASSDVVIVGGGLAGIGAALAAIEAGLRPLVIERTSRWGGPVARSPEVLSEAERAALVEFEHALADGWCIGWSNATVAALAESGDGWSVAVQDDGAGDELAAPLVVLACGGYVEPREHRAIRGPRPSGIATADLVHAALDAGLLPGRRALLVGSGRLCDGTAARMAAAGMAVARARGDVLEVRGSARLDGVRDEAGWHDTDLLVLAERLVPAPFLLRPLGLVDNRPGVPAPAAADGRTELAGLWATGTCRLADVDHRGSLEDGRSVMRAAAALQEAHA
ncbi:MAG TPA: FAD-dependent oxidoreductase [Candidatus Limnocylindria bacterium]|nr:FAD-dependent oxidoreductase [Candidatus Limnocylindria bacterium]